MQYLNTFDLWSIGSREKMQVARSDGSTICSAYTWIGLICRSVYLFITVVRKLYCLLLLICKRAFSSLYLQMLLVASSLVLPIWYAVRQDANKSTTSCVTFRQESFRRRQQRNARFLWLIGYSPDELNAMLCEMLPSKLNFHQLGYSKELARHSLHAMTAQDYYAAAYMYVPWQKPHPNRRTLSNWRLVKVFFNVKYWARWARLSDEDRVGVQY